MRDITDPTVTEPIETDVIVTRDARENPMDRIQQHHSKAFRFGGSVTLPDSLVVYHCMGEMVGGWNDVTRHWLEVRRGFEFHRGQPVGYDSPATIEWGGRKFVGFTAYYDGTVDIEQPLELIKGVEAFPKADLDA